MDDLNLIKVAELIDTYQKLIKSQNDLICEKEERIQLLEKFTLLREKELELTLIQVLTPGAN